MIATLALKSIRNTGTDINKMERRQTCPLSKRHRKCGSRTRCTASYLLFCGVFRYQLPQAAPSFIYIQAFVSQQQQVMPGGLASDCCALFSFAAWLCRVHPLYRETRLYKPFATFINNPCPYDCTGARASGDAYGYARETYGFGNNHHGIQS